MGHNSIVYICIQFVQPLPLFAVPKSRYSSFMDLTVTDLSCSRGDITVVSGVSFSIRAGHTMILRGPNGIGKTTLLRTIAGLTPAVCGTIRPSTEDIAYAGHQDGIKGPLTVYENLRFWARVFGTADITPALEAFDLMALVERPAHTLSAGQKRRLGLSRLLLTGRPIWILDEPTVSLDTENVGKFTAILQRHNKNGGSAIVATHIDLGLKQSTTLDLTAFRAGPEVSHNPFLDEALT